MINPLKRLPASGTAFDYAIFVQSGSIGGVWNFMPIVSRQTKDCLEGKMKTQRKKACA
jgi:hypothetical protein